MANKTTKVNERKQVREDKINDKSLYSSLHGKTAWRTLGRLDIVNQDELKAVDEASKERDQELSDRIDEIELKDYAILYGYYNEAKDNFYSDPEMTTKIIPRENVIYVDLNTDEKNIFIYRKATTFRYTKASDTNAIIIVDILPSVADENKFYYLTRDITIEGIPYEKGLYQYLSETDSWYKIGSSSGGSYMFIGNVDQTTDYFPTARPDGTELVNGDFVKADKDAIFPFTIEGLTFTNAKDQAVYLGGDWVLNANPFQDTLETPIHFIADESFTGTATTQSDANIEFAENFRHLWINSENLDTVTTIYDRIYYQTRDTAARERGLYWYDRDSEEADKWTVFGSADIPADVVLPTEVPRDGAYFVLLENITGHDKGLYRYDESQNKWIMVAEQRPELIDLTDDAAHRGVPGIPYPVGAGGNVDDVTVNDVSVVDASKVARLTTLTAAEVEAMFE